MIQADGANVRSCGVPESYDDIAAMFIATFGRRPEYFGAYSYHEIREWLDAAMS